MNSDTNFLLLIIVAVLLFGSGAVLGFFKSLFWIAIFILAIIVVIWIILQIPVVVKEEVKEIKEDPFGFKKHPVYAPIFWITAIVLFIVLLISVNNDDKRVTPNTNISTKEVSANNAGTNFTEPSGRFSAAFPAYPSHDQKNNEVSSNDNYRSEDNKGTTYYVGVAAYKNPINLSPQDNLDKSVNNLVSSKSINKLITSTSTDHNGFPAKDFLIRQDDLLYQGRLIMVGNTLYQVMVTYSANDNTPSGYNSFLNSFKILSEWE